MAKDVNDKLREFIIWSVECYDVSASPPAVNYSKRVDPSFRDDVNGYSRPHLLVIGIDTKYALYNTLRRLPLNRAAVLMGWLVKDEEHYWHNLTHRQQVFLKIDRERLKERILWKK